MLLDDIGKIYKGPVIRNRHILRTKNEPQPEGEDLESLELYDLDDAENLYKQYVKAFKKKNFTKTYDQTVHYYKFVKSLVEVNRNHYKGKKNQKIDEDADVVNRPNDYFY
jgi:hypothetical protein